MRQPARHRLRRCDVCGETFRPTAPTGRRCSDECRRKHDTARKAAERAAQEATA